MTQGTKLKENKMGTMPINRLLVSMSLPMVISMLVQALYNVVDSMFVAQMGEEALTAVSLSFPIQNLMIAVGAGTGVGINALLSRSLGEKNYKKANRAAVNGIFVVAVSYILFAVFGVFFSRYYFESQTDNSLIVEYGIQYLSVITIFSIGLFMQMTFERLLQSTGNTMHSMISQGTGAIINIILDPILIFGLFGMPKLGVSGAAIATVVGQVIGMMIGIYLNIKKNKEIDLSFKNFKPHGETIKGIYAVGIPSIIMLSISSIMVYSMNKILLTFSSTAVSVLGIYFKLQSFIFMPVFGLNNGMISIVAYNYGARNKKRIMDTMKLSVMSAVSIMLIGLIIFQVFPVNLLELFNASEEMIAIGVPALRTISLSFIFAGFCIIAGSVFQSLGDGILSLIISVIRQLIFILPIAYIFAKSFGLYAVWYAFPLSEIVAMILSALFLRHIYIKKIKNLK